MNLQLVYRCNLSLSKNENMFEKKNKLGKQKQNDRKKKKKGKKISYRGSRTLDLSRTSYLYRHDK